MKKKPTSSNPALQRGGITIDKRLNKYDGKNLFPKKLAKANRTLKKYPPPVTLSLSKGTKPCNHKTGKRETWVLVRPIRMMYAAQPIGDLADYVNNNLGNLLERCTKCGVVRKAVIKCTDPIL